MSADAWARFVRDELLDGAPPAASRVQPRAALRCRLPVVGRWLHDWGRWEAERGLTGPAWLARTCVGCGMVQRRDIGRQW